MEFLKEIFNSEESGFWLQIFVIIFITLLASYTANRFLNGLHKKLEATKTVWDDAIIRAVRRPIRLFIWIVGLAFAIELVHKEYDSAIFAAVYPLRDVGIIAVIGMFLLRLIREVEANIIQHKQAKGEEVDQTTIDAVAKLLRITVIITVGLVVLQTLGFSVSGVLAFGGIGGMAVGFAAKDLLANFFGAMMIYFDRPFAVGDWIRSPDREIEGTVEHIGWRLTRIRTFDKRPLYVPNSVFTTVSVQNPSRMSHRRIYETIGVRYDDIAKVDKIVADVKKMLKGRKDIDDGQTMIVNVNAFAPSSVDFFVYTFTHTTDWIEYHEIKQDVLLQIANIIEKQGAEIAFPTTTVHVPDGVGLSPELAGLALETK